MKAIQAVRRITNDSSTVLYRILGGCTRSLYTLALVPSNKYLRSLYIATNDNACIYPRHFIDFHFLVATKDPRVFCLSHFRVSRDAPPCKPTSLNGHIIDNTGTFSFFYFFYGSPWILVANERNTIEFVKMIKITAHFNYVSLLLCNLSQLINPVKVLALKQRAQREANSQQRYTKRGTSNSPNFD